MTFHSNLLAAAIIAASATLAGLAVAAPIRAPLGVVHQAGSVETVNLNPIQIQQLRQVSVIENMLVGHHAMIRYGTPSAVIGSARSSVNRGSAGLASGPKISNAR